MKLIVIGLGQCGGRIADEFANINNKAQSQRGIEIVLGTFAVNTDIADLTGLSFIKQDYTHRILIGTGQTGGHGVGKVNLIGAMVAEADSHKITEAILSTGRVFETDGFLLVASGAGGTGSGAIATMTKLLKSRFPEKALYDMIILPFEHEERTEEKATYNTALCLKSIYPLANAVFVVDNQRYLRNDASLIGNLKEINRLMVEPFYDLLCAGEEAKRKFIGAKTMDAGDIMQTLSGWTAIGYGKSDVPVFNLPFKRSGFRNRSDQVGKGIHAMEEAFNRLSVDCNPADAAKALYLVSAPVNEMNMNLVREIGDYLRTRIPQATIRNGDYPREKSIINVCIFLSGLSSVEKIKGYYAKSTSMIPDFQKRNTERENKLKEMEESGKDIPSLI